MEPKEKLPKEFKDKWIAALRSGKYKQGDGWLLSAGHYCCLGVACAIQGVQIHPSDATISEDKEGIPAILRGAVYENALVKILTDMNDGCSCRQYSFSEIADWIEENL